MFIPVQNPHILSGFVARFSVMDPFIQIDVSDIVATFNLTRVTAVQVIHRGFINGVGMNTIRKEFDGTLICDHSKAWDIYMALSDKKNQDHNDCDHFESV